MKGGERGRAHGCVICDSPSTSCLVKSLVTVFQGYMLTGSSGITALLLMVCTCSLHYELDTYLSPPCCKSILMSTTGSNQLQRVLLCIDLHSVLEESLKNILSKFNHSHKHNTSTTINTTNNSCSLPLPYIPGLHVVFEQDKHINFARRSLIWNLA